MKGVEQKPDPKKEGADNLIVQEEKILGGLKCRHYCSYFGNSKGCFLNTMAVLSILGLPVSVVIFQLFLADLVTGTL